MLSRPQEAAIGQDPAVGAENVGHVSPHPPFPGQRFGDIQQRGGDAKGAEQGDGPENGPPVVMREQQAAQKRGHDGANAADDHHQRVEAGGFPLFEQIADNGPGYDQSGRAAQSHQKAGSDQRFDRARDRTDGRHATKQQAAAQERHPPSQVIAEDAPEDLADREPQQEDRQGDLHRSDGGAKLPGDLGESGEIHVDGQRGEGRHEAQNPGESSGRCRGGTQWRHGRQISECTHTYR